MVKDKFLSIKKHILENKEVYIGIGSITFAGITFVIMRGIYSKHISRGIPVTASRGIPVTGESVVINTLSNTLFGNNKVLNNVSYFSSNRQGPPSWVVRCVETGKVFTSQRSAALEMDIPENELSRHLKGILDNVRGNTFERICMTA